MAEISKGARPVGRTRRVTGLVLVALAAVICARVGWLGALHGSTFWPEEWIRFGFWLWLASVMALIGLWLAYRSRLAAWAVGLAVAALFIVAYIHDRWLR
jgi:hypothetical protein